VKQLTQLTPAETLILKFGDKAPLGDLLKVTLLDLLLKQVLVIEEIQRQASRREPVRTYKYVSVGKNFRGYVKKPHEWVFLSIFDKNRAIKILFRNLVRVGFQQAESEKDYQHSLVTSKYLKEAFSSTFIQKIKGTFSHTSKGLELRDIVMREIQEYESSLPEQIGRNSKLALETLRVIGGNIFLLKGLEFAIANEIDKEIFKQLKKEIVVSGGCGSGCWSGYDDYSESFDSSGSSGSGGGDGGCSGGSGCSGDSGCSGCSGCGGCGGD
jgi:uncharacterized membrane protein YgcG